MAYYSVTVSTPLSDVEAWARMSDVTRFAEWDPGVIKAEKIGDGSGANAAYLLTVKGPRKNIEMQYDVSHFSAPDRLALVADTGTIRSEDEILIESSDVGCDVTYSANLSLYGRAAFFNPIMGVVFKRIGDRAAAGLREYLEVAS